MDATAALPGFGQLAQRGNELALSLVDSPARGRDAGAATATEGEQRHVVVAADETLEDLRPLLRSAVVTRERVRLQTLLGDEITFA
jgi:hypothetical protein